MSSKKILKKLLVIFQITSFVTNISCSKRVLVPMDHNSLEKESLLHVKLTSGKQVKVKEPRFKEGVLTGLTPIYKTRPGPYKEIRIFLDEIESIKVERFSSQKTILTLGAIALVLGTFSLYLSQWEGGFN